MRINTEKTLVLTILSTVFFLYEILFIIMWGNSIINSQMHNISVLTLGIPILLFVYLLGIKTINFVYR